MRYNNPELIERLASEYVVGTLAGKARQRFERLMMESYKVRQAVYAWEEQLYPMNQTMAEQKPSPQVWKNIQQRLARPNDPVSAAESDPWWSSLMFWRSTGVFTTLAASLMLVLLVVQTPESIPDHVAIVNNQELQPLWLISSDLKTGQIAVKAVNAKAAAVNKAFELWMLPSDASPPRSMGLMPVSGGEVEFKLPPELVFILKNANGLAVSLEPSGGSPTGAPTGPVLYQTALISL